MVTGGTRPLDLPGRLAVTTPRRRSIFLLLYHGVLAAHAARRRAAVARGRKVVDAALSSSCSPGDSSPGRRAGRRWRHELDLRWSSIGTPIGQPPTFRVATTTTGGIDSSSRP